MTEHLVQGEGAEDVVHGQDVLAQIMATEAVTSRTTQGSKVATKYDNKAETLGSRVVVVIVDSRARTMTPDSIKGLGNRAQDLKVVIPVAGPRVDPKEVEMVVADHNKEALDNRVALDIRALNRAANPEDHKLEAEAEEEDQGAEVGGAGHKGPIKERMSLQGFERC